MNVAVVRNLPIRKPPSRKEEGKIKQGTFQEILGKTFASLIFSFLKVHFIMFISIEL